MTAPLFDSTGTKLKTVTLPKTVFAVEAKPATIAQALRVYTVNQAQATAKTKSRGEVSLTKAKWYRQKGTGRARHGAQSAPIFVGGGVAHGPTGIQARRRKLPRQVRITALKGCLSNLAQNKAITLVSGLNEVSGKTKDLNKLLNKFKLSGRTLILTAADYPQLRRAAANLPKLTLNSVVLTNVRELLEAKHLLLDDQALKPLTNWLTK